MADQENYAARYAAKIRHLLPFYDDMIAAELDVVRARAHGRVLELGAGNGTMTAALLELGAQVVVIDIRPGVIEWLENQRGDSTGLTLHRGDINDTEVWALLEPASFDVVVASLIFHDVPVSGRGAFLERVARVLRPGGTFLYADPLDVDGEVSSKVGRWLRDGSMGQATVEHLRGEDPAFFEPPQRDDLVALALRHGLAWHAQPWRSYHFAVQVFSREPPRPA